MNPLQNEIDGAVKEFEALSGGSRQESTWLRATLTHIAEIAKREGREDYRALTLHVSGKEMLESMLTKARGEGVRDAVDYIEAEGEWIKEDAADGNYGYFRADKTLLEAAKNIPHDPRFYRNVF